ncbi:MAG: hypothetical protein NW220_05505 [Leptolyngbyaceae cyanobacterium bins.349]|nr:hypothetical protein [Leptolyngbyaceae cyanobacterium bins.349]
MARTGLGLGQSCGNLGCDRGITQQRLHPSTIALPRSCPLEGVWGDAAVLHSGGFGGLPPKERILASTPV